MEKRFYSGVADLAFNEKSGAVLAVSRRQSDITRWNMGVDGKASRCPARTTIATKSTISWAVQRARQRADHGRPGAQIQRPQGNTGQQPLPRNPLGQQPCGARHQRQHRPPVPGRALFAAGRLGPRAQQPRIGRRRAGHFPAPGLPQYTAGGFGKEQKQQDSWTLKGRVDLDPVRTGAITHIPTPAWNGSGCRPGSNASSNRIPTVAPTTTRAATRTSARSATCPAPWT